MHGDTEISELVSRHLVSPPRLDRVLHTVEGNPSSANILSRWIGANQDKHAKEGVTLYQPIHSSNETRNNQDYMTAERSLEAGASGLPMVEHVTLKVKDYK